MPTYGQVSAPRYGNRNPFFGKQFTELQQDYFANNPQAAFGAYLGGYNTGGPMGVTQDFRQFVESWLPDIYRGYQGAVAYQPDLQFTDYVGRQNPYAAYQQTNPYRRDLGASFRTRLLRR